MEHDPRTQTQTERERAAAEEAAASAAVPQGEATDGVHGAAEADEVPVAPPDADGASTPEAGAAAASVAQAEDDATEPAPKAAEPDYKDQYLRAMAELDNVRKRARRDVSQAEARGIAKLARELLPALDNFAHALDAA